MRALLAGFGRVGRTLAEILSERASRPSLASLDLAVVGITTGSHGALLDPAGLDLSLALEEYRAGGRFTSELPAFRDLDTLGAIRTAEFDVLLELSPLTVAAKGEPAASHVREALARGRHVVSANKGPLAWRFGELTALARGNRCALLYEATVMDGAPVFGLARRCLRGNAVKRVEGVLNSTTNVVLCEMERGASLEEAVAAAQRLGVAEADPRDDLEGWDAAAKVAILANALLGGALVPEDVERESVASLTPERIAAARSRGRRLKVVCEAYRDGGLVAGRVAAREFSEADRFAAVEGTDSVLRITTDILGTLVIAEEGPNLATTAYGVIADLFALRDGDWR